ncbi:MAG: GAF domain-containing protein [Thermodesulfovibrionia bacterium]|nr:GAF domain-containing protein [Thermodesulfovibrionia bacterium]
MTELINQKRSILYYDLQNTGEWRLLNATEKSKVKRHCHDIFIDITTEYSCEPINRDSFRGDDAFAFFCSEIDCIKAGLSFLQQLPDMVRRVPYIEHVLLNPRIIAFNDFISGKSQSDYTGRHMEEILPYEKTFGKAGSFRIVGEDLWYTLPADYKIQFADTGEKIAGKRGATYPVYEDKLGMNPIAISKRFITATYIHKYEDSLYKFFSTNLAARNGITLSLGKRLQETGTPYTKKEFQKVVLDWCRAYLEMTVSGKVPKVDGTDWKFKVSYWSNVDEEHMAIVNFSYPPNVICYSYRDSIKLKKGENIVGECWASGEEIIRLTDAGNYEPLHDKRDDKIVAIVALPVFNPSTRDVIGVLTIDTKIERFFDKKEEIKYLKELLSSFTMNIGLAHFLKE